MMETWMLCVAFVYTFSSTLMDELERTDTGSELKRMGEAVEKARSRFGIVIVSKQDTQLSGELWALDCGNEEQIQTRYMDCVDEFDILRDMSNMSWAMVNDCQNSLDTSIKCLMQIKDECHDRTDYVKKLFDIHSIRDTMRYACENKQKYVDHAECIQVQEKINKESVRECAAKSNARMQDRFAEVARRKGVDANNLVDQTLPFMCKFIDEVSECSRVIFENCSPDLADLAQRVNNLLRPAACNSAISFNSSSLVFLILLLLLLDCLGPMS